MFTLVLVCSTAKFAIANNEVAINSTLSDSLIIKPNLLFRKKAVVKLSPNPTYDGTISVTANNEENLHFYVFDLEGTLLHRIILNGKEKKVIPNLIKGTYTYDVFKNDESVEEGQIIVK